MSLTNGKVLDTIASLYDSLTKTEKRIASTIMRSPDLLAHASLSEVAADLDVGEATFIRFCRTLGFKGFTDFKLELAIEIATREKNNAALFNSEISKFDSPKNIAIKLQAAMNNVVTETINLLDFVELEKVAQVLCQAKRIFFFGIGASGITAEDSKNKFMQIGLSVDAVTNNYTMYMQSALMNKGDVAFGISHSGSTKEMIEALSIAKKTGATIIVLTHSSRSPITQIADFVLTNGNRQGQFEGELIETKVAQLFVLEMLHTLIMQMEEDKSAKAKQKIINTINAQRLI